MFDARQGGSDHILMIGNICVKYVYAVELLRYLPDSGMTDEDFRAACDMLRTACVPPLDDFLPVQTLNRKLWEILELLP